MVTNLYNVQVGDKVKLGTKVKTVTWKTENTVVFDDGSVLSDRSPLWVKAFEVA